MLCRSRDTNILELGTSMYAVVASLEGGERSIVVGASIERNTYLLYGHDGLR